MKTCRGCGAGKPDVKLTDDGHIEVRRKPAKPKREPITAKPTSKYEGSAQDRQARGEGFCESFMDRARKKESDE